jgi:hypothetical protein
MNNQIEIFVRNAEDMESDIRTAVKELHKRTAYIQYQKKVIKKPITYSDSTIANRARELGMKILSITQRSVTLLALSQNAYYKANQF